MRSANRTLYLLLLTVLASTTTIVVAQKSDNKENTPAVAALVQQIAQQRMDIEKLRNEVVRQSELVKRQQALLETLIEKLDKFSSPVAASTTSASDKPETIVPAASKKDPASNSAPVSNGTGSQTQTDKPPNVVENGFGKVKFTGVIQAWFGAGDRGFADTFRIRRAEMKFTGDLLPNVKWTAMFDLAKILSLNTTHATIDGTPVVRTVTVNQASRIFQEAYITLSHLKNANVNIGQFKVPLSQEALQSTSTLDTVERALFLSDRSRGGGLADNRDLGVMAFGPLGKQFDYQLGVFNGVGESQNDVDENDTKAVIGRLVFHPTALKGFQIGGSGAWAPGTAALNPRHHRLGAEILYQRDKLRLKSEYMGGIDGDTHRRGYYAHAGYRFLPKLEGIFRFDMFDPETGRESTALTVTERDYIAGFNYYFRENNFKVQVNYLRKTFAGSVTPSRNLFLVNLQTAW
jgi:uncharacterized coiled-coil protein SlyX